MGDMATEQAPTALGREPWLEFFAENEVRRSTEVSAVWRDCGR